MGRTEKNILLVLRILIIAALFSPLVYYGKLFFPYVSGRTLYFQIITELIALIGIIAIVFFPGVRPRFGRVSKVVAISIAVIGITTFFADELSKSFFGTIERGLGFFQIIHFGFLFFGALIAAQSQRVWNGILGTSIAVALIAALHFLIPALFEDGQLPKTLTGNQSFLATYLMFHVFFAAYLVQESKKRIYKIVFVISIAILVSAILATGVRATFVGLSLGALYLGIISAVRFPRMRTMLIVIVFLAVGSYGTLFILKDSPLLKNNFVVSRFTNFSLADSTIISRLSIWRMAASGAIDRPLTGWGRDNFSRVFNMHYHPSFEKANVAEEWEDRAHNVFFDELTASGIFGLAAYIFVLFAAGRAVRKQSALSALLIAYTAQNLFGVDTLNTYLPFFLFLGLSDFLSEEKHELPLRAGRAMALKYAVAGSLTIVILLSTYVSVRQARGNHLLYKTAYQLATDGDPKIAEDYYEAGKKMLEPFSAYKYEGFSVLANYLFTPRFLENRPYSQIALTKVIADDLLEGFVREPYELRYGKIVAKGYENMAAVYNDPEYLRDARDLWRTLVQRMPGRLRFLQELEHVENLLQGSASPISASPRNP